MDKFTVFIDMLDYLAKNHATVTDADMNYYRDTMKIVGENDGENITIEVTINKKEENEDA